jgi:hypothetical protein
MKRGSDLLASSNRPPQEKKKWGVEPVAALLMALATLSTATGVFFVVVSRLFGNRFKLKTS